MSTPKQTPSHGAQGLGFTHRYTPAPQGEPMTLLLLHGTGGDETDLLPLGELLAPGAGLLSPRGQVLEHGMPRFFRRLAEGVFDVEDLRLRTQMLAEFVTASAAAYGFDPQQVIAVGYSNGANIAASLLLLSPGVLRGAVLFHAQVPLEPPETPDLADVPVLLTGGRSDPLIPSAETERLAALLRAGGAEVTLEWQPNGHALSAQEVHQARQWLTAVRRS
jgi:phospholipase/carboxylesterase/glyoxalase family protein